LRGGGQRREERFAMTWQSGTCRLLPPVWRPGGVRRQPLSTRARRRFIAIARSCSWSALRAKER